MTVAARTTPPCPPHEEGEPETLLEPDVPLSPETVAALEARGVPLSDWQPTVCRCRKHARCLACIEADGA